MRHRNGRGVVVQEIAPDPVRVLAKPGYGSGTAACTTWMAAAPVAPAQPCTRHRPSVAKVQPVRAAISRTAGQPLRRVTSRRADAWAMPADTASSLTALASGMAFQVVGPH
ncbi:MAG: hypothetical protein ACK5UA_11975 [Cereibacter sp.]